MMINGYGGSSNLQKNDPINPGHWFGREGAGFARVNIACPRSVLKSALIQLETAINS